MPFSYISFCLKNELCKIYKENVFFEQIIYDLRQVKHYTQPYIIYNILGIILDDYHSFFI